MADQQQGAKPEPGTLDDGLGVVKDGWFTELSTMWPGQGLSLEVDEVMFRGRSKFQVCTAQRQRTIGNRVDQMQQHAPCTGGQASS